MSEGDLLKKGTTVFWNNQRVISGYGRVLRDEKIRSDNTKILIEGKYFDSIEVSLCELIIFE